jgi:hypothetical protein
VLHAVLQRSIWYTAEGEWRYGRTGVVPIRIPDAGRSQTANKAATDPFIAGRAFTSPSMRWQISQADAMPFRAR